MKTNEDIESYLVKLQWPFDKVKEGMWVIHDEEDKVENLVVLHEPPVVIFRVKLMEVPEKNREKLFRRLLQLNAHELVHGAYGLEDGNIVLIDTLESENLDFNEFQASVESLIWEISAHYQELVSYRK